MIKLTTTETLYICERAEKLARIRTKHYDTPVDFKTPYTGGLLEKRRQGLAAVEQLKELKIIIDKTGYELIPKALPSNKMFMLVCRNNQ